MGKTLDETTKVHNVEIVRHGDKLVLPQEMTPDEGIDALERFKKQENTVVELSETFDVFPWDGAYNLDILLKRKFGWTEQKPIPGFFGSSPPETRAIDIDVDKVAQVPWGIFGLMNVDGQLATGAEMKNGRWQFKLSATVKKKFTSFVTDLFGELRTQLATGSIYRGKAIRIRFTADNGKKLAMPEPKFIRTDDVDPTQLVYSNDVMQAIQTNLFTPIGRVDDCIANGLPVKRGVLLAGPYGTGKTLAAKVASQIAVNNGVTFLYIDRAADLAEAIAFGRQYRDPAVAIFCEDIDRVFNGDERTVSVDDILNTIDGIDSKSLNLITVLTTNHVEGISQAMLRPGRLDAIIEVSPPDAEAVERLLRVYAKGAIPKDADLSAVGVELAGTIPATITEVVKRAKLSQLSLQPRGTKVTLISPEALLDAARTMKKQRELLEPKGNTPTPAERLFESFGQVVKGALNGTNEAAVTARENTRSIGAKLGAQVN